jgi:hypothetical protein
MIAKALNLGEWGAGQVLPTPIPQALSAEPGRSPGVMMPWLSAIPHIRDAVSSRTPPTGAA